MIDGQNDFVERIFQYQRDDNHVKCIAVILKKQMRFVDSDDFSHFCKMIRNEAKKLGVKVYYTTSILEYEKDLNAFDGFARDKFGNRIARRVSGWLFETGKSEFNKQRILKAFDIFKGILRDEVSKGAIIFDNEKSKHNKLPNMNLEMEILRLKGLLKIIKEKVDKDNVKL